MIIIVKLRISRSHININLKNLCEHTSPITLDICFVRENDIFTIRKKYSCDKCSEFCTIHSRISEYKYITTNIKQISKICTRSVNMKNHVAFVDLELIRDNICFIRDSYCPKCDKREILSIVNLVKAYNSVSLLNGKKCDIIDLKSLYPKCISLNKIGIVGEWFKGSINQLEYQVHKVNRNKVVLVEYVSQSKTIVPIEKFFALFNPVKKSV